MRYSATHEFFRKKKLHLIINEPRVALDLALGG